MKNSRKISFIVLLFMLIISVETFSQVLKVTGKVLDTDGEELIGVNVLVRGTSKGTITDEKGNYSVFVEDGRKDVLVFSYIGMKTQEVPVNGRTKIDVILEPETHLLDEVVAIGYGSLRRGDLTGSVSSVKGDDLIKVPTSNVAQSLAGRVAGVHVLQSEGVPGASISIRVRGGISITQSNEPLYVIDGFPTDEGLSTLDPSEIESIDILKDASATSIYGARGANGVVLITTKSGLKDGRKQTISFDTYVGINKVANKLPVLSTEEFVLLDYERRVGGDPVNGVSKFEELYGPFADIATNYRNRSGIDWQKETLGRTAITQNYRIAFNGGSKETQYNFSYWRFNNQGAMVYSGEDKDNITFNISHRVGDRFRFSARLNYDQRKVYGMGTSEGGDRFNKMQHILQYRPTIGIKGSDDLLLEGEDPLLLDDSGNVMQNPLISAAEETKNKKYKVLRINGGFTYNLTKKLSFRNNTSMRYQTRRDEIFYGALSMTAKRSSINGSITYREIGDIITSNTINHNYKQKGHKITTMIGQEYVYKWNRYLEASSSNFPNDDIGLDDLSLGSTPGIPKSNVNYDDKLLSFFARINYNYREKYLLSSSIRADGSSKFGKKNKWGIFPAFASAWRISEEEFIKNLNIFSDLKLRCGYGWAGNNSIGSYGSLPILGSVTYPQGNTTRSGYASNQIPNSYLKWEANKTFNLGLDMGFFQQRLTVIPEFYINKSSNLLLNSRIPMSSGYSNMIRNIGVTENRGLDLTINTININKRNFSWSTNFNISHNRNKVLALSGENYFLEEARFGYNLKTHLVKIGEPLGLFYGFVTEGVYGVDDFDYDPNTETYILKEEIPYLGDRNLVKPGNWKFKNIDDSNDIIDENDKTIIGKANPKFYGGITNDFNYKNFDLSIFFSFNYGNDVFNATKLTNSLGGRTNKNALDVINSSNRWMTINKNGEIIKDPVELGTINNNKTVAAWYDLEEGDKYIHSWAVEDGSYIRLSNVSLGYTIPKNLSNKLSINNLRFYVTGNNLYVWTKYTGYDPDVSTMGTGITRGVDFGAYPRSRSVVFGMSLTF